METRGAPNIQNNLDKQEQSWKTHTSCFNNYYKVTVFKMSVALEGQTYRPGMGFSTEGAGKTGCSYTRE